MMEVLYRSLLALQLECKVRSLVNVRPLGYSRGQQIADQFMEVLSRYQDYHIAPWRFSRLTSEYLELSGKEKLPFCIARVLSPNGRLKKQSL